MPVTVAPGAKGLSVTLLQERLNKYGYDIKADGVFGPKTEEAVEQFQAAQGFDVDGIVGPRTWDALLVDTRAPEAKSILDEQRAWVLAQVPIGLPKNRRDVLEAANGALGLEEQPPGSNGGAAIGHIVSPSTNGQAPSDYWKHWKANIQSMPPWCAIYVSWALKEGVHAASWSEVPFGDWFGAVSQIEEWAKLKGHWTPAHHGTKAEPAAVFTMARSGSGSNPGAVNAGHTGFVVADIGSHVITMEGNVSNRVAARKRPKSTLRGFVTWW